METKAVWLIFLLFMVVSLTSSNLLAQIPVGYKGTPFHNDSVKVYPIRIPGKLQCEFYDFGGFGVAYGGTKALVNGINVGAYFNKSQNCNEGGTPYLCTFRDSEAVAISYTKPCCDLDGTLNSYPQTAGQMYTGWTSPNQWLNYTVHVDTPGVYSINFLYTAALIRGLEFSLSLNHKTVVKLLLPNTFHSDSIDNLRWHRWNKAINIAEITLPDTGEQLVTFNAAYPAHSETADIGNFDYIEFVKKGPASPISDQKNILHTNGDPKRR
jgi:hypothetical protein